MFVNFFFKFRIWDEGIQGKTEARSEGIPLYTFLRIFPRKINILKKSKLGLRELNKLDDTNIKKMLFNLADILKSTAKMSKKKKRKEKCSKLFYIKICHRALQNK